MRIGEVEGKRLGEEGEKWGEGVRGGREGGKENGVRV